MVLSSAQPEQVPELAQVKLIPEARSEPTGSLQTDTVAAGGQHREVNPFPAPAPGHGLTKLHSSSWDHKNTAVKLNDFGTTKHCPSNQWDS